MKLRYTSPSEHEPGTVFSLLKQAWTTQWNPELEEKVRQFDREVTEYPDTVGVCTFITCLETEPVGMASYDPRQKPEKGIIGWNCVTPQYQRRGFGRNQIQEIIRIFQEIGIRKACVTTTNEDFFIPAQKTYESCGFIKSRRTEDNNIEYEMRLG